MASLMVLPIFPRSGFDQSVTTPVLLGILASWLFTETFGWVFAGLVVPGYLASVFLLAPAAGVIDIFEAMLTYFVARPIGERPPSSPEGAALWVSQLAIDGLPEPDSSVTGDLTRIRDFLEAVAKGDLARARAANVEPAAIAAGVMVVRERFDTLLGRRGLPTYVLRMPLPEQPVVVLVPTPLACPASAAAAGKLIADGDADAVVLAGIEEPKKTWLDLETTAHAAARWLARGGTFVGDRSRFRLPLGEPRGCRPRDHQGRLDEQRGRQRWSPRAPRARRLRSGRQRACPGGDRRPKGVRVTRARRPSRRRHQPTRCHCHTTEERALREAVALRRRRGARRDRKDVRLSRLDATPGAGARGPRGPGRGPGFLRGHGVL